MGPLLHEPERAPAGEPGVAPIAPTSEAHRFGFDDAEGAGGASAVLPGPVCVDTHAHLHNAFPLAASLRRAVQHARRAGGRSCVLCLASTPAEDAFDRLAAGEVADGLRFERSAAEPTVLVLAASADTGEAHPTPTPPPPQPMPLVLVEGRQLVTAERIEVLALAPEADALPGLRSGLPLGDTLAAVAASGAVMVLPHGVGKWLGRRGRAVSRALDLARGCRSVGDGGASRFPRLCVADNAGRFTLGPRPSVLDQAAALGVPVLAGSDPLPLLGSGSRLGGMGVVIERGIETDRVAATLRKALPALGPTPRCYGSHAGAFRSAREQLALRLLNRKQKPRRGRHR